MLNGSDPDLRDLIASLGERGQVRKCEYCHQPLPNERYHLRICPKCRTATIDAYLKGEL